MANESVHEWFSIRDAYVLDGVETFRTAAANLADDTYRIFGCDDASLDAQMGTYENRGDGDVQSIWDWLDWVDVQIREGFFSFKLASTITGDTVSSSGTTEWGIDLWHEDSIAAGPKPVVLRGYARDKNGLEKLGLLGLYKVQFKQIAFTGPAQNDGLKVNWTGRALRSDVDEVGAAHADGKRRVGKMLMLAAP